MKPKLLLDIDGVLNPFAAKPEGRPEGYETFRYVRTADGARLVPKGQRRQGKALEAYWRSGGDSGMRVWLNPAHGPMLVALSGMVDLVWATAWEGQANDLVGPVIGLPQLPVIAFPRKEYYEFGHIFKLGDVVEYIGDEPFAWLDDDFERDDLAWAKQRTADGIPTLLVPIAPNIGLRQEDLDWVRDWASRATPS